MPLISSLSLTSRFTQLALAASLLVGILYLLIPSGSEIRHLHIPNLTSPTSPFPSVSGSNRAKARPDHPIDHLIQAADAEFAALLQKQTSTLHDAAEAYRQRRGRQPPPNFDLWYRFAQNTSSLIIEDFFDQIYTDIAPFWGIPAAQIRLQANTFVHKISVREGKATGHTDVGERQWINLWRDMIQSVAEWAPDVDVPINVMDESRVVVPWEEIDNCMAKERASRKIVPEAGLKTEFESLASLDERTTEQQGSFDPGFEGVGPYWQLAVVGCPPGSPARGAYIETDFRTSPPLTGKWPDGSYMGFVQNWTLARSPCDNANLQGLHGTFIEPVSIANTKNLVPLFGGSKLPMNNEILLPPAMYWTDDPFYSGGNGHGQPWEEKNNGMIWRGAASGGRNKEENWRRFQRHRFVSMANATAVKLIETGGQGPGNFVIPANNSYSLAAQSLSSNSPTGLSDWLTSWSNAAFVHLLCFPDEGSPSKCSYSDQFFRIEKAMPMEEQYVYKYLPDLDGNSFSGRYRAFLYSTSLPIKATIYQEWHDSRLIPWTHFVPMDNTFIDFYGLMEYFIGNERRGVSGHDDMAAKIAVGGKAWAEKVLRKEDMQVYVLRLLLEYARLCDDERENMGWRDDGVG